MRIDGQEAGGESGIASEACFGGRRPVASPVDQRHPVFALRVVEDPLRIVRRGCEQGCRGAASLLEFAQGCVQVAAQFVVLAHGVENAGAAAKRVRRQAAEVLVAVIGERAPVGGGEDVEPPHPFQPVAQVGQHEFHQPLSLGALPLGFGPRGQGDARHPGHD